MLIRGSQNFLDGEGFYDKVSNGDTSVSGLYGQCRTCVCRDCNGIIARQPKRGDSWKSRCFSIAANALAAKICGATSMDVLM